jgi:hypothetical protein
MKINQWRNGQQCHQLKTIISMAAGINMSWQYHGNGVCNNKIWRNIIVSDHRSGNGEMAKSAMAKWRK